MDRQQNKMDKQGKNGQIKNKWSDVGTKWTNKQEQNAQTGQIKKN